MTEDAVPTRDPDFWTDYYQVGIPPWQINVPCPPAFQLLDERPELTPGPAVVVGCGLGLEPLELARRGFEVTALDLSPYAIAQARERAERADLEVRYRVENVCEPAQDLFGAFDYVLEQTCYCAIDPRDRPAYVRSVHGMLRPGGVLFGVFFELENVDGPPFPITLDEIRADFAPTFEIEILERARHSAASRAGKEWLALFRRR